MSIQHGLESTITREVGLADGRRRTVPYVGQICLTFGNRVCYVGAMVMGDETLLGAVPMEDLELIVHPSRQAVIANPDSPNMPAAIAKGFRA